MKKTVYLFFSFLFFSQCLTAQGFAERVVFTTGGSFGAPENYVHVYSYQPDTEELMVLDNVLGDFSNDIIADGKFAYAHIGRTFGNPAGDDVIYKYNILTGERVDSITQISGTYRFAVYNDHFIVAKSFAAIGANVQFYNKNDLASGVVYEGTEVPETTGGLMVFEEYDAVFVSYTEANIGKIAIYSLANSTPSFIETIELDTLSSGISDMLHDGTFVYALSQRFDPVTFDLIYAGISKVTPMDGDFETVLKSNAFNAITIAEAPLVGDVVLANFGADGNIVTTGSLMSLNQTVLPFYSDGVADDVNQLLYLQETDYFSYGQVTILSATGAVQGSFETDISGSAINMVYNNAPIGVADNFDFAEDFPPYDVLANDSDPDGNTDELTIEIITQPTDWVLEVTPDQQIDIVFNPGQGNSSPFQYALIDCWGRSAVVDATISFTLNANEAHKQLTIKALPNPTQDEFTLDLSAFEYEATSITLYDLTGKIVYTQADNNDTQAQISLGHLPAGVYLVEVRGENNWARERIMKW